MAALAFLLAPARPVPTERDAVWLSTVQSFLSVADARWVERREGLADVEKTSVPRWAPGTSLSSNAMSASRKDDPALRAAAAAWADRVFDAWRAAPGAPLPVFDAGAAHAALGLDSRMSLADLVGDAGGFKAVPAKKLTRGGSHAFLKQAPDDNALAFGEAGSIQRALFEEVVRGHGGVGLAVWSFGRAVHILIARAAVVGGPVAFVGPLSARIDAVGGARRGDLASDVASAVASSGLTPDVEALRRELSGPSLSVSRWFAALGISGVEELTRPDAAALWRAFDAWAGALLAGSDVDKAALKKLTTLVEVLGCALRFDVRAPVKLGAGRKRADTARVIVDVAADLEAIVGPAPSSAALTELRALAAPMVEHRAKKRAHVAALVARAPKPLTVPTDLVALLGPRLRYRGALSEADGGFVTLRLALPVDDDGATRDLRNDLQGKGLFELYGEAWTEGGALVGYTCSDLDIALLSQVLADVPAGTTLSVWSGVDALPAA